MNPALDETLQSNINADVDTILDTMRPMVSTYLSRGHAQSDRHLEITVRPLFVVGKVEVTSRTPYKEDRVLTKIYNGPPSRRAALINPVLDGDLYPTFGCDLDVKPGVVERWIRLDTARPKRKMEIVVYETAHDLVFEWLAGFHNHIPFELRFIKGESIARKAGKWTSDPPVDVDYPSLPRCELRALKMLFGMYASKARTPGVRQECAESGETVVHYKTLEDMLVEWRLGKHPDIPHFRRIVAQTTRAEKYRASARVQPSDYPARPLPFDQVPPCEDPEMARLFGSERYNVVEEHGFPRCIRAWWARGPNKTRQLWYGDRPTLIEEWLLGHDPEVAFEDRFYEGQDVDESRLYKPDLKDLGPYSVMVGGQVFTYLGAEGEEPPPHVAEFRRRLAAQAAGASRKRGREEEGAADTSRSRKRVKADVEPVVPLRRSGRKNKSPA
ncbi:hypothetical protein B0H11DRAFT_323451 [Mycena galericulata]|nr:hypothetical protein B0H11DRAFT_323451 [Mycena galericulata]